MLWLCMAVMMYRQTQQLHYSRTQVVSSQLAIPQGNAETVTVCALYQQLALHVWGFFNFTLTTFDLLLVVAFTLYVGARKVHFGRS